MLIIDLVLHSSTIYRWFLNLGKEKKKNPTTLPCTPTRRGCSALCGESLVDAAKPEEYAKLS